MGYPKHIYERARQTLDSRRNAAREQSEARREKIRREIPGVAELERVMARQASEITRAVIASPDTAGERIEELARENLRLQRRREELIRAQGYPGDYLEVRYSCGDCRDTGYIAQEMCGCMKSLLRQEAAAQLSRVSPVASCTFDGFSLEYYSDTPGETGSSDRARMSEVRNLCRRWCQSFLPRGESLLLIGRTGLGKTHLSIAMAHEVTQAGYGVIYTPVQRMMDILEAEKFSRDASAKEQYRDATSSYLDCDLLVLDDLGTEFMSQFVNSALFNILNTRLVEERPTIISTNLELPEIESRYSQRMVSRLICAYRVLRFVGKDIRYMKKLERSSKSD